ncbi:ECF RNA polymerase sigma factor SigW [Thermoflexales bacterium]|jgi:RNA polymerase sigma-70 factor (ECF subfamily)|nr:ECF RNA polymerase sigma factor SigW [Thermoflexales bacterium]
MNRLEHSDTAELITRSCSGDPDAIESLVHTYTSTVYRLAVSMLDDVAEAEEATQDTLLLVIKRLPSYRGEASFSTWLYTITLNVCRDRLRKRRTRERLTQVLQVLFHVKAETHEQIEQQVMEREADAAVWQAIKTLPDKEREVVVLRYYHQLRQESIAQMLGVSDRTVRTRLSAAHAALRAALQGKGDWT